MVKGEWSFTHFQDHLSFVAIADAAGAASGNTTAEVPEADACSRGGRREELWSSGPLVDVKARTVSRLPSVPTDFSL